MISLAVILVGLAPVFWHQFAGHSLSKRLQRIVRPSTAIPETAHERRFHARPIRQRILLDGCWVAYIAAVTAVAFAV
jgi:hypothetical protein